MRLTGQERTVLELLAEAYSAFVQLPNTSESDRKEFTSTVHQAQAQIAVRVARRADPAFWRQPPIK